MALKELMIRLKNRASDTPDTPEKNMGYQLKPSVYAGCTPDTPDTPCFGDTREKSQVQRSGSAANDPAPDSAHPPSGGPNTTEARYSRSATTAPPTPTPEPPADPNAWRELAQAYHGHHFRCTACIGAGQGRGLRCGAGAALWRAYQDAV